MFKEIDFEWCINKTNEALKNLCVPLETDLMEFVRDGDNQQTSANFTKFINSILVVAFKRQIEKCYPNKLKESKSSSYDVLFDDMEIEIKCTLSKEGWTGNKASSKKGPHLFIYYELDEGCYIKDVSVYFVNIDILEKSSWSSSNSPRSGWSKFRIHNDDLEKVEIIRGNLVKKVKWTTPTLALE